MEPMNTTSQLQQSSPSATGGAPTPPSKGGVGPIVGAIIVIALLIFGGLYFWGLQVQKSGDALPFVPGETVAPVQDNNDLSSSDDPDAIAQDADDAYMAQLEADLDADMKAIESY